MAAFWNPIKWGSISCLRITRVTIILKSDYTVTKMVYKRLRTPQNWVLMVSLSFFLITHLSNLEFVAGRADQVHKAKPVTDCYLKAIPC